MNYGAIALHLCSAGQYCTFTVQASQTSAEVVANGCAEVVMDSVNQCDVDVRRDLYGGVVLTGQCG